MSIISKFRTQLKYDGISITFQKVVYFLLRRIGFDSELQNERLSASKKIMRLYNNMVAFGPFKGMKISEDVWWGEHDRAPMILGLYEKEVQEYITNISNYYDIFIDLGAADGFFGIGALISKKYKKSYCFEITHEGQEAIIKNAKLNHVENDVIIEGLADQNFMDLIPNNELKKALILCDIEGGEFDLFTDEALIKLKNNLIVIEIHDFLVENGEEKLSKLLLRCSNIFDYKFLTTTSRDLSNFDALNDLTDNQRWLICSEGRPSLMKWLVLSPK
jgi:hypothetical protein